MPVKAILNTLVMSQSISQVRISIEIFNLEDGSGNIGEECWYSCDRKSGECSNFCGQDALCCREGWKENGCDGAMGGDTCHICVSKDPALKIAKSPY